MIAATIRGLGAWLPEKVRTNADWPPAFLEQHQERSRRDITRVVPEVDEIGAVLMKHAASTAGDPFRGGRGRRVADEATTASEGEAIAGAQALKEAGLEARDIDMVFSHSLVPDRLTPPNALLVAERLGLTRAAAFGVDAVCASAVAQLIVASAMVESGRAKYVLVVQSHLIWRTLDEMEPLSVMFGDAATAMVIGPAREGYGLLAHVASADGSFHGGITWERCDGTQGRWYEGGRVKPGTDDRDAVRRLTARLLHMGVENCRALFDAGHTSASEIDVLVTTQPTGWFPAALAEALGIPGERAPCTFADLAHIGAAGVVTNLMSARERGSLREGAMVALYALGAGANRTGALLRWG